VHFPQQKTFLPTVIFLIGNAELAGKNKRRGLTLKARMAQRRKRKKEFSH